MEDGPFNTNVSGLSDLTMDLDLMDELLLEGCWLETTDAFDLLKWGSPAPDTLNYSLDNLPSQEINERLVSYSSSFQQTIQEDESKRDLSENLNIGGVDETQAEGEGSEVGRRWWIAPSVSSGPYSVKQRLMQAIRYLNECTKDKDVLIQLWVPVKSGDRNVLTTTDQPYTLDSNSESLQNYRSVSEAYQFPADEDAKEYIGMPGRVFLGKLPEWTPDVRFFRTEEYPRVSYALQCDVRGSLALPVFERGSGTCLGVVEIVSTSQKINYEPELENVCRALEAVDLRSSPSFSSPSVKACNQFYQAALPQIREHLTSICKAYRLPLALTWASCIQQGKEGRRHSSENYNLCVSTVDFACFVADERYSGFHKACSEHHLLRGQGIVGRAFMTNRSCFAADVTAFSRKEYPLSHHARMFELQCAVATPLMITSRDSPDFVLEFFLPKDCKDEDEQNRVSTSLSSFVLRAFENSQIVSSARDENCKKEETKKVPSFVSREGSEEKGLWISNMMDAQQKGKGVGVSLDYHKKPKEEFKVTNEWEETQVEVHHNFESKPGSEAGDDNSIGVSDLVGGRKLVQTRRARTEKTISLQLLRQYFAGSLKDAAKSLGVCPTTLKRICRQHGITRWPSRKIKKVGHSLRKLQLVMDSVQGAEGTIPIGSFYKSFPELKCSTNEGLKQSNQPENLCESTGLKSSPSSSCSQSSSSTTSCSSGTKQELTGTNTRSCGDSVMLEDPTGILKRVRSDAELHVSTQEEPKLLKRSQSQKTLDENLSLKRLPPLLNSNGPNSRGGSIYRVKAMFGDEKIRFSLQPKWGFRDLQLEVAKRFGIDDVSGIDLKYLDDDHEWVLLTCDADLEECVDVYKMSQVRTIRIALHRVDQSNIRYSFGSI
ncbi:protein NLP2-like isoform X1 [Punica granatum]|uniref:Protein NLP2-like isoform X1 n=1 Tax=Punica granatum TaxID=22663 RepID=A0A6P8CFC5_PUNGR|nr:protein NLP2-like isoform X1 [Punica granatum]XP_031380174.1 protein NLP2-like isoform X1 [Punica granatum]XP_031380175.1 protein NLP2-like isoform X1 [Punica granatum]XP_031380176.1 protein NLP2-like isoform X1 [Punica granatum]XP_031380177.1 protein NLP2-like isoform X1 [Punica granatum]XP_031380178.1 protein NLP2-like isoform X1 [Punica granatum]